jgi:hypothetical protein
MLFLQSMYTHSVATQHELYIHTFLGEEKVYSILHPKKNMEKLFIYLWNKEKWTEEEMEWFYSFTYLSNLIRTLLFRTGTRN